MIDFVYFEDSWNEPRKENRAGKIQPGGTVSTSTPSDDSKGPRGQEQVHEKG